MQMMKMMTGMMYREGQRLCQCYEGFAINSIGQKHVENKTPCQDSVQYLQDLHTAVAAVADGHGSEPYFRSDTGSKFAAEIGCRAVADFLKKID